MSIKNSNDTIGNRTRDLPTCNVVPQPTAYSPDMSLPDFDLFPKLKKPLHGKRFKSIEDVSNEVTPRNQTHQQRRRPDRNTRLAQTLHRCYKAQWRWYWRPVNVFCKINLFLKRIRTVCRTFEMTHVYLRSVSYMMCGRIETCLLIGVELVREGCGLSVNRTQKREGRELSVSLFYTIRSRCHEQWEWDEM
jgi:hypothetical protein